MKKYYFALTALLVLFSAASAQSIVAEADAYVNRGGTNSGSSTGLVALNDAGTPSSTKDYFSLLRFDISSVGGYDEVSLILGDRDNDTGSQSFTLFGIPDLHESELFNESSVTFSSLLSATNSFASTSSDGSVNQANLISLVNFTGNDDVVTMSSSAMKSFADADTNNKLSFVLFKTTQSGANSVFNSKDGSGQLPTLTFTMIPEPSSLAFLAGLLGVFCAILRRQR